MCPRRRLSTDVSSFSELSSAIADDAIINVLSDITFTGVITISGVTNLAIRSSGTSGDGTSGSEVMTFSSDRSFSSDEGGMFHIANGSSVAFAGLHFASGSASSYGGCIFIKENSNIVLDRLELASCYAGCR